MHHKRATLPRSISNGAHVSEVVIDPETRVVTVERYTVVDDFGNLINPICHSAEGSVHGRMWLRVSAKPFRNRSYL